jgi:hypothetical protein
MVLCSRVPGRERWYVSVLEGRPRFAAAVELLLRCDEGIVNAQANPLTGKVLVQYRPGVIPETPERLIRRALEFGPMSREEFSARPITALSWSAVHFLAAEIACTALKMTLFGGYCSLALGAAGLLFLLHRRTQHAALHSGIDGNAARVVPDQPRRIEHYENGTQVVQHRRNDRIDAPRGRQI